MKHIYSNNTIAHDLVQLMGTFGSLNVKKIVEGSKFKDDLVSLLEFVLSNEFVDIRENKTNVLNKVPYQSVEKALRDLKHFTKADPLYKTEENKLRKLDILLESLGYVESDAVFKLVTKQFDVVAIQTYLHPPAEETVKKNRQKKS